MSDRDVTPDDWQRTIRRHATMSAQGILVLHCTPNQIRSAPAAVATTIADTLRAGRARAVLPVTARPAA
jgi:very-short-patch-repair endonuclease